MNPIGLAIQILQAIVKELDGQPAAIVKEATEGAMQITSRIARAAVDVLDGDMKPSEAAPFLSMQYDALKIVIETAIGEGELAIEKIPNAVVSAVENVVFGTIGHLL